MKKVLLFAIASLAFSVSSAYACNEVNLQNYKQILLTEAAKDAAYQNAKIVSSTFVGPWGSVLEGKDSYSSASITSKLDNGQEVREMILIKNGCDFGGFNAPNL